MESVLVGLAALACPVGMGLMMWLMSRGTRRGAQAAAQGTDVDALRAEHRRIGEEIDRIDAENASAREVAR